VGVFARLLARPAPRLDAAAADLAPQPPAIARPASPPGGRTMLREAVMAKVLHGWLQNRHQTLFPLAVNLRTLDAAQRATLARITAVLLLAEGAPPPEAPGTTREDPSREAEMREAGGEARARRWLLAAGADAETMRTLDEALADPPASSRAIDAVLAQGLAPYAYVAALVALDTRDGPGPHLLEYLAARLALPATLVRSANRRHRR
jgi:hypothetical protein